MVNVYTAVFKAHFTCFSHLLEYLQLAKIKAWIWGCTLLQQRNNESNGKKWPGRTPPLSMMNSPLDHQREPRACPASLNSLGGDTPGEKAKCKLNYKNLFFHLLCLLPSLVGTGDSSLKVALTIAYAIPCLYN